MSDAAPPPIRALPCASCGAALAFDPGAGQPTCPHCGEAHPFQSGAAEEPDLPAEIVERDYAAALRAGMAETAEAETRVLPCPGCGAEVALPPGVLAGDCPYCATPLAKTPERASHHPAVQAVVPFALTEREARARMKAWLGRLWFAPSALKRYAEAGRPMTGIYVPHYTYDAEGSARYTGARGDAYYVTRTRTVMVEGKPRTETYQERRVSWRPVAGRVARQFDDVLVPASATLETVPGRFDLGALTPYRADYVAGFQAETPQIGIEGGFAKARDEMETALRHDVRQDIGGDEQRILTFSARYDRITFKHVLLPVWLAAYRWRNQPYRVTINGQTGAVAGERPYAAWKIAVAVVLALLALGGVLWLAAEAEAPTTVIR